MSTRAKRKFSLLAASFVALAFMLAFPSAFQAQEPGGGGEPESIVPIEIQIGRFWARLTLDLEPQAGVWWFDRTENGKTYYSSESYQLQLQVKTYRSHRLLNIKVLSSQNQNFTLRGYELSWNLPAEAWAIWSPNSRPLPRSNLRAKLPNSYFDRTRANFGIPFFITVDASGNNVAAAGLIKQDRQVDLACQPFGVSYSCWIQVTDGAVGKSITNEIFLSDRRVNWYDAAVDYTAYVDNSRAYRPLSIPAHAYEPIYNAIYWRGTDISQPEHVEIARRAKELGFVTYFIDAGWESSPDSIQKGIEGDTGNYTPPLDRYPNFSEMLRVLREELGMRVMLWMQPYSLGNASIYDAEADSYRYWLPMDYDVEYSLPLTQQRTASAKEYISLDPRHSRTRTYLKNLMTRVMTDYRPDALWIDFIDFLVPVCIAPHTHSPVLFGDGLRLAQQQIVQAVQAVNPDTFMEFRFPYGNLHTKPFMQVYQAPDAPGDFDQMRLMNLNFRPFSRGLVMGTDEMYWNVNETSDTDAAKFIITVIFSGVPAFGPDIMHAPQSQLDALKAWLSFYQEHKADFNNGAFRPVGSIEFPDQKIETSEKILFYYRSGNVAPLVMGNAHRQVFIANASDSEDVRLAFSNLAGKPVTVTRYNFKLEMVSKDSFTVSGDAREFGNLSVPVGGLVKIEINLP